MTTNFSESLAHVVSTLEKTLSTKTVIGEPTTFGSVTLVPVMDVTFGFGGGGGEGKDAKGENAGVGSGSGAGARLSPKAVIVINGSEVSVMAFTKGGTAEKLIDMIPTILDKVSLSLAKKGDKGEKQDEAPKTEEPAAE